jgi:hypothetical protein
MKPLALALLGSILMAPVAFAAAPQAVPAAPQITVAQEAVTIFRRVCVETGGDVAKTEMALKPFIDGGIGAKVPAGKAKEFTRHDSKATGILFSPTTKQKLMVDYDMKNVCSVHVNRAPAPEIRAAFKKVVGFTAASLKGKVAMKTEPKTINGNALEIDLYEIIPDNKGPHTSLSLASSDKPVGDTQHYMTYATLKAKK